MDSSLQLLLVKKVNNLCGLDDNNLIYSLVPSLYKNNFVDKIHTHSLFKLPMIIDASCKILTEVNTTGHSYPYTTIQNEKENLFRTLAELKGPLELDSFVVQHNKIPAALAIVSSIYFSTFVSPIQFFLPNSSACCGQWEFWEKNNYFNLLNRLKEKEFIFALRESINGSKVWETRFKPEDFTEIVKRRLSKENAFDKKLNAEAMMKAMIIRMGEMAKPHLNYEIVDYSIRSFFSSLGVKNYLRVDREIKFLRKFEKEMIEILRN